MKRITLLKAIRFFVYTVIFTAGSQVVDSKLDNNIISMLFLLPAVFFGVMTVLVSIVFFVVSRIPKDIIERLEDSEDPSTRILDEALKVALAREDYYEAARIRDLINKKLKNL